MTTFLTWDGNPAITTQPWPFIISGLVVFAFLTVSFIFVHVYLTGQIKASSSRFSTICLKRFRILAWLSWTNICLMPTLMMFYPAWTLRLAGIVCMGSYFLWFLYNHWKVKIQIVDPYIVEKMQDVITNEIRPAIVKEESYDGTEQVQHWAESASDKLDDLIARLRGKTDATRND